MTDRTKAEQAFEAIRARIETGDLQGGARLTLQRLSSELGMSHTPVREALRMLQASGLVTYRPHTGHMVSAYSLTRAEETYLLRRTLEPLATRLAGERSDPEALRCITALNVEFQHAVATGASSAVLVEANARWHQAVHTASGVALLREVTARLWQGVPYQAIWFMTRRSESAAAHRAITEALIEGRSDDAATGMLDHIRTGETATLAHLASIGAPRE